jgi:hypothetical protein
MRQCRFVDEFNTVDSVDSEYSSGCTPKLYFYCTVFIFQHYLNLF